MKELVGPCHIWQGGVNSSGYARHRQIYEATYGPVPEGLELDHLCRVRRCLNPDHLEPVTPQENSRRAAARVTHCPRGHAYTEKRNNQGARVCLPCDATKAKARRDAAREAAGLPPAQPNKLKTACHLGHPLTPDGRGWRRCLTCNRERNRRWRAPEASA